MHLKKRRLRPDIYYELIPETVKLTLQKKLKRLQIKKQHLYSGITTSCLAASSNTNLLIEIILLEHRFEFVNFRVLLMPHDSRNIIK